MLLSVSILPSSSIGQPLWHMGTCPRPHMEVGPPPQNSQMPHCNDFSLWISLGSLSLHLLPFLPHHFEADYRCLAFHSRPQACSWQISAKWTLWEWEPRFVSLMQRKLTGLKSTCESCHWNTASAEPDCSQEKGLGGKSVWCRREACVAASVSHPGKVLKLASSCGCRSCDPFLQGEEAHRTVGWGPRALLVRTCRRFFSHSPHPWGLPRLTCFDVSVLTCRCKVLSWVFDACGSTLDSYLWWSVCRWGLKKDVDWASQVSNWTH